MRKFVVVVIALVLCLSFVGCSYHKDMEYAEAMKQIESMNVQIESMKQTELSETQTETEAELEPDPVIETSTEDEENNAPILGHADLLIPDAKDYDVIEWPTYGIATNLPVPTWSDRGQFYGSPSDETMFWAEIGYTTLKDYEDYVEMCKAYGFNQNIQEEPGSSFIAYNEDGYMIDLLYVPWSKYVDIQLTY